MERKTAQIIANLLLRLFWGKFFAYATGQIRLRVKYLIDAGQNSQAARLLPTALYLKVRSVLPAKSLIKVDFPAPFLPSKTNP